MTMSRERLSPHCVAVLVTFLLALVTSFVSAYIDDSMMKRYTSKPWMPNTKNTPSVVNPPQKAKDSGPSVSDKSLWRNDRRDIRTLNKDEILRIEYDAWANRYGKTRGEERFKIWAENMVLQMEYNQRTGEFFLLNEFGDCTVNEYRECMALQAAEETAIQQQQALKQEEQLSSAAIAAVANNYSGRHSSSPEEAAGSTSTRSSGDSIRIVVFDDDEEEEGVVPTGVTPSMDYYFEEREVTEQGNVSGQIVNTLSKAVVAACLGTVLVAAVQQADPTIVSTIVNTYKQINE